MRRYTTTSLLRPRPTLRRATPKSSCATASACKPFPIAASSATTLRVTHYKKRTIIAFDVDSEQVSIIGVFYGGQDFESILKDDFEGDA